ncbi:extracellular serine-rich protein [Stagonosporopsis vannaccii]|nr:extracellular serine-rich protein [Stagonosporopsis vannaccii]
MVRPGIVRLAAAIAACQLLSTTAAQDLTSVTGSASRTGVVSATLSPVPTSLSGSPSRSAAPATSSTSNEPAVHTMKVGSGGFKFTPDQLFNVSAGDTVTFEFYGPDHSVVQAEFGSACVPYSYVDADHAGKGFWTDLQFLDPGQNSYFNITVNDTAPIFFYCAAPGSCIDKLMVGAINANSTQTLASQIQAAQRADFQIAVGEPIPNEATSTILNAPTATPTHSPSSGTHLSGGAIAGIVVGGVAFLVICAALFFYVGRSKSLKEVLKRQDGNANRASTPGPDMGYIPHEQVPRYGSPAPAYVQHNVGEQYPSGWQGSPQMHQGHLSMQSHMSGMSQEQLDYYKHTQAPVVPAEMHSPQPGQQDFRAELADSTPKPPRSP